MTTHKAIREALGAGPTEGVWVHNKQGYPKSDVRHIEGRNIANTWETASKQAKTPEAYKARTDQDRRNAAFIAACNPAAIRALLADLDAKTEALKSVQAAIYMDDAGQLYLARSFDESVIDAALKGTP